jgi:AraC-like DNA-binding protein
MGVVLSASQILQLSAIGPLIFLIIFACIKRRFIGGVFVPALFFANLFAYFITPLLSGTEISDSYSVLRGLHFVPALFLPETCFLLLVQLRTGKFPEGIYWLVMAFPTFFWIFGVGEANTSDNLICLNSSICVETAKLLSVMRYITGAIILMWALVISRTSDHTEGESQKYIISLGIIVFLLLHSFSGLANIAGMISTEKTSFIQTLSIITLIYLAGTALFRIEEGKILENKAENKPRQLTAMDIDLADKIKLFMDTDRPFLDAEFNRGKLADKFRISEQHLSFIINNHFGMTFTDMVNMARLEQAKQQLKESEESVINVAHSSGFNSIASFNRVFKNNTGMNPTEYRRNKI